jgi:hypothetical protein
MKIILIGVVGAREVVFDPDVQPETRHGWGLGESTNNQAKTLALYWGLRIIDS